MQNQLSRQRKRKQQAILSVDSLWFHLYPEERKFKSYQLMIKLHLSDW